MSGWFATVLALLVAFGCTSAIDAPSTAAPTTADVVPGTAMATAAPGTPAVISGTHAPATRPVSTPSVPIPEPTVSPTVSVSEIFPRDSFADPTTIDNAYFPLTPGSQFVYRGEVTEDGERLSHRVVFTITDLTKVIDGVRTIVAYDVDYTPADQVAEVELAFFAQDDHGNVWLMGEYPEEYDEGILVDAPTWISGIDDAKAGIIMPADPNLTSPSYAQGWAPAVEFADRARTFELGSTTCVRTGCFEGVLVIDEFNVSEPDAHQLKYYAPGLGVVRVGYAGALDEAQEVLELARVVNLDAQTMDSLRQTCLLFDAGARERSTGVYALTEPLDGP